MLLTDEVYFSSLGLSGMETRKMQFLGFFFQKVLFPVTSF